MASRKAALAAAVAVAVVIAVALYIQLAPSAGQRPPSPAPTQQPTATAATTQRPTTPSGFPTSTQQPTTATPAPSCSGAVLGYIAPTLVRLTTDAAVKAGLDPSGIQSVGSVEGLRRIQQGSRPDVYGSVDIELLGPIQRAGARQVLSLGRFRLAVVARRPLAGPGDLASGSEAMGDPSKAPIGYRELAAMWMLSRQYGVSLRRYEELGIRFAPTASGVNITVPIALPSTAAVSVKPNLDGAWSAFEVGGPDFVFAYVPFLLGKGVSLVRLVNSTALWDVYQASYRGSTYYVHVLKPPYDFAQDPPLDIYVAFLDASGKATNVVKVGHFEAFLASFSERGDCVLAAARGLNLTAYGFLR